MAVTSDGLSVTDPSIYIYLKPMVHYKKGTHMLKRKACMSLFLILFVLSAICLIGHQCGDLLLLSGRDSDRCVVISRDIEAAAEALGYSRETCRNVTELVSLSDLSTWKERLSTAKQDLQQKTIQATELGTVEEEVATCLYNRIRKEIQSGRDFQSFDLGYILNDRTANCLGFSQLFYILGNSIGLPVQVVEVRRLQSGSDTPHVACLIHLSDDTEIMADLVEGGFMSARFHFLEEFIATNDLWELKDGRRGLHIHRKIKLWDKDELKSAIYCHRADWCESTGRHAEAMCHVDSAILLNPKNGTALCFRAVFNKMLGDFPSAISDATKAIEINPRNARAYEIRGSALSRSGDHLRAVSDFSRAIEIDPKYALAYVGRGYSSARSGKMEEARKDLQKAGELDPSLKELVAMYSQVLDGPQPEEKHSELRDSARKE